jgi:hypothetical protein
MLELKLVLLSKDKNDVKEHLAVFILIFRDAGNVDYFW